MNARNTIYQVRATHVVDISNQTASLETVSDVGGKSACTSKVEYPDLPNSGAVPKKPVVTERIVANVPHCVQNRSGYALAVKAPQQTRFQESNQMKTLNDKMAQYQSRLQNTEKLIQQLQQSLGSREKENVYERNDQTNEGACFTRIQNTENAVNDLYTKLRQMDAWIQNCQHPVNSQLQPVQNATCQTQVIPNVTHPNSHVFHYAGYIPQAIENFGNEERIYTSL